MFGYKSNSCLTERPFIGMQTILPSVQLLPWRSLSRPAVLLGTSSFPGGVLKPHEPRPSPCEGFLVAFRRVAGSDGRQLTAIAWDTRASATIASAWPQSLRRLHSPLRAGAFLASFVFVRIPLSPHEAPSRPHSPVHRCAPPPPPPAAWDNDFRGDKGAPREDGARGRSQRRGRRP